MDRVPKEVEEVISRRTFVQGLGSAGLLTKRASAAAPKRSILFIAIDDLNDWIGCLGGHPQTRTPNLDRLAGQGVLFTNAHCAAPLCNPSRAALMTGMRPAESGVYKNTQPFRMSPTLKGAVTLPMHLRAHGYRALGSGKIYHGEYPDPQSWDEYWPDQQKNRPADPTPPQRMRPLNGIPNKAQFDWGALAAGDEAMGDWKVTEWVARQLAKKWNEPLFLACGLFRPHLPWYVPQRYFDMHPLDRIILPEVKEDDLNDVPAIGKRFAAAQGDHEKVLEYGQWKRAVQSYLAAISFADAMVGRVLRALETGPSANETMVVLWSDHGWHLGEKLHWRKFSLWEEATRNVLMMNIPGVTKAGGQCQRPVSLMDIGPTLYELIGLPARKEWQGVSLLPQLKDPGVARREPALTTYLRGNHSVRDERWRYTRYADGGEELYDHSADPMEWTNLAGRKEHAAEKERLARWLPKQDAPDSPEVKGSGEAD